MLYICKTHIHIFIGYFKNFVATYFLYWKIQFSWFSLARSKCLKYGSQWPLKFHSVTLGCLSVISKQQFIFSDYFKKLLKSVGTRKD